jgi:HD-GYP domain-containing protein (c-di-GMP phosphodiesterase class II)
LRLNSQTSICKGAPFAAIFLDVNLPPGPSGIWAAEQILQIDPAANIVLVTGHIGSELGKEMGLADDPVEGLNIASAIHDIGKISLPAEILSKPSQLNSMEMSLIQAHSRAGYDILKSVDFPWPVADIVLQHHERLNGTGYPQRLAGEGILKEARIVGVADVVETMSSHRPYRPSRGLDSALEEISAQRGALYDRDAVDACLALMQEGRFAFTSPVFA